MNDEKQPPAEPGVNRERVEAWAAELESGPLPTRVPSPYTCEAVIDMVKMMTLNSTPALITCGRPARLYGMAALCEECAKLILSPEDRQR